MKRKTYELELIVGQRIGTSFQLQLAGRKIALLRFLINLELFSQLNLPG
jgi:hypothetical protein